MAKKSVLKNALTDEVRSTILREAEDRYRNELMDEERMLLQDRIGRLSQQLKIRA